VRSPLKWSDAAAQMVVFGLATARLTQLVVDDEITQPLRTSIAQHRVKLINLPNMDGRLVVEPLDERVEVDSRWTALDEAVNCHACTSIWAAGGVLLASSAGPVGRFLTHVLALSQAGQLVQSLIERIDR
jgi:hypothetical protein